MARSFLSAVLFICFATSVCAGEKFTVVLLPDTQFYSERYPETYNAQTRWIKERAKEENIRFVIHLGDIVQNDAEQEWKNADAAHKLLDGHVPYSVLPGNHDMPNVNGKLVRDTTLYNKYFPPSRFAGADWYGGHLGEKNDYNYCTFTGGGMNFLVVSLEFAPTDAGLAWAHEVIEKHPDHKVIVATHCYLRTGGRDTHCHKDYNFTDGNCGQDIWDKLIKKHANIFLVACGHIVGVRHQESRGEAGNRVLEMLVDYQGLPRGGSGWLRTLTFDPAEKKIHVRAYSPLLKKENSEKDHTYTIDFDLANQLRKAG